MNKKISLAFLVLLTYQYLATQSAHQVKPGRQINIAAADSLVIVAPAVKRQLYPLIGIQKKVGAAHLLLTGGNKKIADNYQPLARSPHAKKYLPGQPVFGGK
jgi:hypothetical protein